MALIKKITKIKHSFRFEVKNEVSREATIYFLRMPVYKEIIKNEPSNS